MTVQSFRDLIVWQRSMQLAKSVYTLGKQLPGEEKFGLVGQMQRCAVSIPSNIAEGSKRGTTKDYLQFLRIALGSSAELETQLLLSGEIYSVNTAESGKLLIEVQKMLESLIRTLKK